MSNAAIYGEVILRDASGAIVRHLAGILLEWELDKTDTAATFSGKLLRIAPQPQGAENERS